MKILDLIEFRWVEDTAPYANGEEICYVGKWRVGTVSWESGSRVGLELKNEGACSLLPGLKKRIGYYSTREEAKAQVEKAAAYWFLNCVTIPAE